MNDVRLRDAVAALRHDAGLTWRQIGMLLGCSARKAQHLAGGGAGGVAWRERALRAHRDLVASTEGMDDHSRRSWVFALDESGQHPFGRCYAQTITEQGEPLYPSWSPSQWLSLEHEQESQNAADSDR